MTAGASSPTPFESPHKRRARLAEALATIEHAAVNQTCKAERVDVARLRMSLGMTQTQFAQRFGFALPTLRHWEQGDRVPRGPALALLNRSSATPAAC